MSDISVSIRVNLRSIKSIRPYDTNPRKNDPAVDDCARSIATYGFRQPIVIDPADDTIVVGDTRYKAALKLGLDKVPVHVMHGASPEEIRAYRIADNRVGEIAKWDESLLVSEIQGLRAEGFDTSLLGWDANGLAKILGEVPDPAPARLDDLPEAEPVTRLGDLWVMGEHRLLCGDATDPDMLDRLLADHKPALMVTDPPYGIDYDGGAGTKKKRKKITGDLSTSLFFRVCIPVSVSAAYIWHSVRFAEDAYRSVTHHRFEIRAQVIWHKLNAHYGGYMAHYMQKHEPCIYCVRGDSEWSGPDNEVTVWEIVQPSRNEHHPTQKPVECMARAIRNHSTDVFDPFVGSGTTIVAAEHENRRAFAMEIDPKYCDVAVARWEALSEQKARRHR